MVKSEFFGTSTQVLRAVIELSLMVKIFEVAKLALSP